MFFKVQWIFPRLKAITFCHFGLWHLISAQFHRAATIVTFIIMSISWKCPAHGIKSFIPFGSVILLPFGSNIRQMVDTASIIWRQAMVLWLDNRCIILSNWNIRLKTLGMVYLDRQFNQTLCYLFLLLQIQIQRTLHIVSHDAFTHLVLLRKKNRILYCLSERFRWNGSCGRIVIKSIWEKMLLFWEMSFNYSLILKRTLRLVLTSMEIWSTQGNSL